MNPQANRLVQQRLDGTCFLAIPAAYRDELGIKGGTIIRYMRTSITSVKNGYSPDVFNERDALLLEVVGWQEPRKKGGK